MWVEQLKLIAVGEAALQTSLWDASNEARAPLFSFLLMFAD